MEDLTYVATFQAIHDTVQNFWFGIVFFEATPAAAAALVANWHTANVRNLIGVCLVLYLVCVVVTVAGNVPLDDELAEYQNLSEATAATARSNFEDSWNQFHVIWTLAVVASQAAVTAAAIYPFGRRSGELGQAPGDRS